MTILGPDGQPLRSYDRETSFHGTEEEQEDGRTHVVIEQEATLMAMARRQRDGASLTAIIYEYDLQGEARNWIILQRALNEGHRLLAERGDNE